MRGAPRNDAALSVQLISRIARRQVATHARWARGASRSGGLPLRDHLCIAQNHTALLSCKKASSSALTDHAPLLLGERRVDVQREWINVTPKGGDNKRRALSHQARDKRHIARQAIELG